MLQVSRCPEKQIEARAVINPMPACETARPIDTIESPHRGTPPILRLRISSCRFHGRHLLAKFQVVKAFENIMLSRALSGCGDRN
jgi:hypothetical protein